MDDGRGMGDEEGWGKDQGSEDGGRRAEDLFGPQITQITRINGRKKAQKTQECLGEQRKGIAVPVTERKRNLTPME